MLRLFINGEQIKKGDRILNIEANRTIDIDILSIRNNYVRYQNHPYNEDRETTRKNITAFYLYIKRIFRDKCKVELK